MDANQRTPATPAGTSVRSILNQAIVSQTKSHTVASGVASSCIQTSKGSDMPRVYIQPIFNRKEYMPVTLHYFIEELDGSNRLSKRFGLSPATLLKKAVEVGLPTIVKSLEENNNKANGKKS